MESPSGRDVEVISFDLDGTLIRYERAPGDVLSATFDRMGIEPLFAVEEYYARYDEFSAVCESMDELRSECFAALAAENGYEEHRGRAVAEVFSDERDQSNVELLPGAAAILDELSREYRMAIVTNGPADAQRQKIEAVDLRRWVDTVVIAGHETPPKPDPEPFDCVRDTFGVTPETTVHIGDSLETDIAGATAAGLEAVWISEQSETREFEPAYHVESLGDLWPLPWRESSSSE